MTAVRTGPRPLTDAERDAWTMHVEKTPVADITARTGLSAAQIAAAVDLARLHAAGLAPAPAAAVPEAAPAPAVPPVTRRRVLPTPRAALALTPPAPWRPEPVADAGAPTDRAIPEAPAPPAPAAEPKPGRRPAREAPRDRAEQIRVARAVIEVLRTHLAQYEAELAELLGQDPVDAPAPAAIEPEPAALPAPASAPDLADSETVRAWAVADGWAVPPPGIRLPGAIVRAYTNAHPDAGGTA